MPLLIPETLKIPLQLDRPNKKRLISKVNLSARYRITQLIACKFFAFLFLLLSSNFNDVRAQEVESNLKPWKEAKSGWWIGAGLRRGNIFKHTPKFEPEITETSYLFELECNWQTNGKRPWHQSFNYPEIGLSLIHARFGDASIFGRSTGLLPSLSFVTRTKKLSFFYGMGIGLAYITRSYNHLTNSSNNVIGSKVNTIASVNAGVNWQFHPRWRLLSHLSFTHWSNAKFQMPNLGVNIPALGFTLQYSPKGLLEIAKVDSLPKALKKVKFSLRFGNGITESGVPGGPKFNVYVGDAFLSKRSGLRGQYLLGLEFNYYMGIYHFVINHVAFKENQKSKALKAGLYAGYELLFGPVGLRVTTGYYLYDPFLSRESVFSKVGLQYYFFPVHSRLGKQLYTGVYLKTHYATADYLEIGFGYVF